MAGDDTREVHGQPFHHVLVSLCDVTRTIYHRWKIDMYHKDLVGRAPDAPGDICFLN